MSKKDEYFALMEAQIKKWDAEVDKLKVKGEQLSAEASAKYAEQLNAMRANRDAAYKKLQEMRGANESAWQHMQSGIDTAWASDRSVFDEPPQVRGPRKSVQKEFSHSLIWTPPGLPS